MSLSEANRKYFDAISDSYDAKPWFAKVNQQVTDVVRSRLDWLGIPFANQDGVPSADNAREVRLLDYACGTGLMTRIFGPYVTVTLGMDVSPKMVESYNSRIQSAIANLPNSGTSSNIPHAITADLLNKSDPDPAQLSAAEYYDFDLAAVGFAFHHFEDVVFAAQQLKKRLRPGGVLFINDFLEGGDMLSGEDGEPVPGSEGNHAVHSHGHGHGHSHHHGHSHDHKHGHEHKEHNPKDQPDEPSKDIFSKHSKEMQASIVVPHFTLQGVHDIFSKSGFVDVEVISMKEKVYMEFGGKKLWRTVLFAKGRKPLDEEQMRSEL